MVADGEREHCVSASRRAPWSHPRDLHSTLVHFGRTRSLASLCTSDTLLLSSDRAADREHTMDDTLEMPTAAPKPDVPQETEEEENSSGDEDQGPDWTKIPYVLALCPGM